MRAWRESICDSISSFPLFEIMSSLAVCGSNEHSCTISIIAYEISSVIPISDWVPTLRDQNG